MKIEHILFLFLIGCQSKPVVTKTETDYFKAGVSMMDSGNYVSALGYFEILDSLDPGYEAAQAMKARIAIIQDSVYKEREEERTLQFLAEVDTILSQINSLECTNFTLAQVLALIDTLEQRKSDVYRYRLSNDDRMKAKAPRLIAALKKKQIELYPKFRRIAAKEYKAKLWREDIDVSSYGTTIAFSGGLFASNANIEDFNDLMLEELDKLRFQKVQYRWYKESDEYTSYTLKAKADSNID